MTEFEMKNPGKIHHGPHLARNRRRSKRFKYRWEVLDHPLVDVDGPLGHGDVGFDRSVMVNWGETDVDPVEQLDPENDDRRMDVGGRKNAGNGGWILSLEDPLVCDAPVDQMILEKDEQMLDVDRRMKDGDGAKSSLDPLLTLRGQN